MKIGFQGERTVPPEPQPARSRRRLLGRVAVSLGLHFSLILGLLAIGALPSSDSLQYPGPDPETKPIEVELVAELPKPQDPVQKDKPREPEPPQSAEPAPLPDEPIQKEKAEPPQQQEAPPLAAPVPPPPQLYGEKVVKTPAPRPGAGSKADTGVDQSDEETETVAAISPEDVVFRVEEEGRGKGAAGAKNALNEDKEPLTQSERDFLLAQILKYWRFNYSSPEGSNLTLTGHVVVMPDGMLAPPFKQNQPWKPQEAMPQYAEAVRSGNELVRRVLESFYLALRLAQPLLLPPDTGGSWPRRISVSFRFQDLPKHENR